MAFSGTAVTFKEKLITTGLKYKMVTGPGGAMKGMHRPVLRDTENILIHFHGFGHIICINLMPVGINKI
jgi:hypothetical protein